MASTPQQSQLTGAPALKIGLKEQPSTTEKSTEPGPISIHNPEAPGTGFLHFTIEGERLSPGRWCSGCRNGGKVVLCLICKQISYCDYCIDFELKGDGDFVPFTCPSCFLSQDKKGIYPFRFKGVSSAREVCPKILTETLAVISIHLEGLKEYGSPSIVTYQHLFPWLHGNIVHIEMDFNLNTSLGLEDFNARLDSMLRVFEDGDLQPWKHFFIFITTHSDPNNGYLHISPENSSSVPVSEIFKTIFIPRFKAILQRSNTNILTLLSSGAVSKYPGSRSAIVDFSKLGLFDKIITYSQPDFRPASTHKFLMDVGLNQFILDRKQLRNILREHQTLGAHTNIILFQHEKITTFMWTHPGACPFGFRISIQCPGPGCNRLKTTSPKAGPDPSKVTLICSVCKFARTYMLPAGWKWVNGPPSKGPGDERGAWLYSMEDSNGNKMDTGAS